MRLTLNSILLPAIIVAAVMGGGWLALEHSEKARKARSDLLDESNVRQPLWARWPCRGATPDEQRQHRTALEVLEVFDASRWNQLQRGAVHHFAYPGAQRRDLRSDHHPCPPTELYPEVAAAAVKAGIFGHPFLGEAEIALAQQLGPRDPSIVGAVARTAFHEQPIPGSISRDDQRPHARLVLAEFGAAARPWAGQAMAQVSANDQMGTGAAQVAVAGGEPRALAMVQAFMEQILSATPKDKPLPIRARNRIFELTFALGMAGEQAQPYAAPLIELLDRKVQSWAPPFGLIELSPGYACIVAERIGGGVAEIARANHSCQAERERRAKVPR
jgi:hypothetical protein